MTNSIYNTLPIEIHSWNNGAPMIIPSCDPSAVQNTPFRLIADDSLWSHKALENANRFWKCIPEDDLPRYAAIQIQKGDKLHPIKYLIMLAAQAHLKNGH